MALARRWGAEHLRRGEAVLTHSGEAERNPGRRTAEVRNERKLPSASGPGGVRGGNANASEP